MPNLVLTLLLSTIFFFSCSQVNTDSREYYQNKKNDKEGFREETKTTALLKNKFRHGIIPIPHSKLTNPKVVKKLNKKSVALGAKLYKNHCMKCHGANANGHGPESTHLKQKPKDLVAIAKKVPNFKLYMMVSQWKDDMPGWKSILSEKETEYLRDYILSLTQKIPN